nr:MAG TPA: hypothetical protein [Caudoviricetes sp.]
MIIIISIFKNVFLNSSSIFEYVTELVFPCISSIYFLILLFFSENSLLSETFSSIFSLLFDIVRVFNVLVVSVVELFVVLPFEVDVPFFVDAWFAVSEAVLFSVIIVASVKYPFVFMLSIVPCGVSLCSACDDVSLVALFVVSVLSELVVVVDMSELSFCVVALLSTIVPVLLVLSDPLLEF